MNVVDTVTSMIRNYPGLYKTRADALKHCFTSPRWSWVNGDLVPECDSEIKRDPSWPECIMPTDDTISGQLRQTKRAVLEQWRVDNAYLLAQDDMSTLTHNCIWLPESYNRFADMPYNVNIDWHNASRDIAWAIFSSTKDAKKGSHEYNAHRALIPFLIKQGMLSTDKMDSRIAELEAELTELYRAKTTS